MALILLHKKEGETPLEALEVFRNKHVKYKNTKMTYAGRLDPMASGVLLILSGEDIKNKEKYLALDKEYKFEVLFGFATDTYDILGKAVGNGGRQVSEQEIKKNLKYFTGKFTQKYPLYSSKNIKKVRAGSEVEASERDVHIKSIKFLKLKTILSKKILQHIEKRIKKVKGDFRQKEIIKLWRKNLKNNKQSCIVADFKIKCSSGTYVRSIANTLGEKMRVPALAYSIQRTKLGKWSGRSKM